MGEVITFFEKPGCRTNRKQQALLREAGYELAPLDLLQHPWHGEELETFFAGLPVPEWFNPAAPAVKDGSVNPAAFDRDAALARLAAEPLLIRRPLLQKGERRMAGFDRERLRAQLGVELAMEGVSAPEGCSRTSHGSRCP